MAREVHTHRFKFEETCFVRNSTENTKANSFPLSFSSGIPPREERRNNALAARLLRFLSCPRSSVMEATHEHVPTVAWEYPKVCPERKKYERVLSLRSTSPVGVSNVVHTS